MQYTEEEKKAIEYLKEIKNNCEKAINKEYEKNDEKAKEKADSIEIVFNLLEKQQKEIDCLKNHVHYIKCKNCNKEIRTKRSDTKYCSECSKKVSNKNYINNLSEEQKEKRRMKARETMRKIRAGR